VILFCRAPSQPYIYCGRLTYMTHSQPPQLNGRRSPIRFIWQLTNIGTLRAGSPLFVRLLNYGRQPIAATAAPLAAVAPLDVEHDNTNSSNDDDNDNDNGAETKSTAVDEQRKLKVEKKEPSSSSSGQKRGRATRVKHESSTNDNERLPALESTALTTSRLIRRKRN
jgi:hypothetical protein